MASKRLHAKGYGADARNLFESKPYERDVSAPVLRLHRKDTTDDVDLAARCVAGEKSAQMELFAREKRRVHATLFRVLGSNTYMDDLVQDSFLEVFRSLRGYRGEASLSTWIDRCVVRVAFAHLSKKKKQGPHLELVHEPPANESSAEERSLARDATRQLYRMLDELPAAQRIAFVLHVVEGRPIAEIAKVTSASNVATKVRIFRARREIERRARAYPALAAILERPE